MALEDSPTIFPRNEPPMNEFSNWVWRRATTASGLKDIRVAPCLVSMMTNVRCLLQLYCGMRDGSVLLEAGRMRMWFSSGTLGGGGRVHSIQETSSSDGVHWSKASPVQIERAYAPTVIKHEDGYQMWYTVPGSYPWLMKHARSDDGRKWIVTEEPVLKVTQEWEHYLQIYPTVTKIDSVYLMWYASYLHKDRENDGDWVCRQPGRLEVVQASAKSRAPSRFLAVRGNHTTCPASR